MAVTIELPPEAQAQLEAEASRRGISFDRLIVQLAAGLDETPAESNALGAFFGRATQATRNGPAVTSTSFGTSSPNDATSRPPDCGAAG